MDKYNFQATNPSPQFFDREDHYDPLEYEKLKNGRNEFGIEVIRKVPSEGEVRLLGNRHRECLYYSIGLQQCKRAVIEYNRSSYLPCKDTLDAMFRCYTNESDSSEYHKMHASGQPYVKNFMNCFFTKKNNLENCMVHFENSIRALYRDDMKTHHGLIDY